MKILDDLEALLAKATPAPWGTGCGWEQDEPGIYITGKEYIVFAPDEECSIYDAEAIAAAHNALPALLKVARASIALRDCGMKFDDDQSQEAEFDWMAALNELAEVKL